MNISLNKKIKICVMVMLVVILFTMFFNIDVFLNADENKYENEGAYYRVSETVVETELYEGVYYQNDSAFTAITDESRLIGKALGSEFYGDIPLNLNEEYTQNAHILTIPKESEVSVVPWALISNGQWKLSTILNTARDYESSHPGYKVIAAFNGDFFDINAQDDYPYTTNGSWVSGGDVYKGYNTGGWDCVAFDNSPDAEHPFKHYDSPTVSSNVTLSIYDEEGNIVYERKVDKVNEAISTGEVGVYYGIYLEKKYQETEVENAFIVKNPIKTVAYSNESFYGKGEIDEVGSCVLKQNQFALKSNDTLLNDYLKKGTTIRVQHELSGEISKETEVSGCWASFLVDGLHNDSHRGYDYMEYRYPRTLIGYKENGDMVVAVTDGRQANKGYYGLNGVESAAQMAYYGCEYALTLDGGGSATMAILQNGELSIVNSPSDGSVRSDGNALLVVTRVPEVEMEIESSATEISIDLNIIKMIDNYKALYIEVNNEKKKYENKTVIFNNLNSKENYVIQLYAETDDGLVKIPIQSSIKTKKIMFEINSCSIKLVEINGIEYYEIAVDYIDIDSTIAYMNVKIGKEKFFIEDGKFLIERSYGSPLTCGGELVITYVVNFDSTRETYVCNLSDAVISDSMTIVSSIFDRIEKEVNDIFD